MSVYVYTINAFKIKMSLIHKLNGVKIKLNTSPGWF